MSEDAASHFLQKLRSQLLPWGRALRQSVSGGGGGRHNQAIGAPSHSDIEMVPPLHLYPVRLSHSGGSSETLVRVPILLLAL